MKLFILPHAGGSAKSYCAFKHFLPQEIELVPLEPSGRGARLGEPFFDNIPDCVTDLIDKNLSLIKSDSFAIFGHSMGTMFACEMTKQLKEKYGLEPVYVFLSGKSAPDDNFFLPIGNNPDDDTIIAFFVEHNMLPVQVTSNEKMLKLFGGILCADIKMSQKYCLTPDKFRFECPVSVLYGEDDEFLKLCDISGWKNFSKSLCDFSSFSGGHFYYSDCKEDVCKLIVKKLSDNPLRNF